jgi:hypothetical protein
MPQPTAGDVHINRPLTSYSTAFLANSEDFVATKVFPIIGSQSKSDDFWVYDRADWMRMVSQRRAPGAPSAGGGYTLGTDTFTVERWAIHNDVDDPTRANADDPLAPDNDATEWVSEQILRRLENEWLTQFFVTGAWTQEVTPGTLWSAGGSTPIEDVRTERRRIWSLTGKKPNKIVMNPAVFDVLVDHPDILARISFTGGPNPAVVSEQTLAALFQVDEVLQAGGVTATSAEGAATDTFDFMAGDNLLLCYVNPSPGPRTATAGATFAWTGLTGSSSLGNRIKRFRIEENESDRIEGEIWFDQKQMADDLGMLFLQPIA